MNRPQFRTMAERLLPPFFFGDDKGEAYGYSLFLTLDLVAEWFWLGVAARFPDFAVDDENIAALCRDRGIVRGPSEPMSAIVRRLKSFRQFYARDGSPFAIMDAVAGYLFGDVPKMHIVTNLGTWYTRDESGVESTVAGGNWDWDTDSVGDAGVRFWLILEPSPADRWSVGTWGDGTLHGDLDSWGGLTVAEEAAIRLLVNRHASAGSLCDWIIVAHSASDFAPGNAAGTMADGTWGIWSDLGTNRPPSRNTAFYYEGRSK